MICESMVKTQLGFPIQWDDLFAIVSKRFLLVLIRETFYAAVG
jgi:hypothetical protein